LRISALIKRYPDVSAGCPKLASDSYILSAQSFNYRDIVTVMCTAGYSFTGDYEGLTSVTLTCQSGGQWNPVAIPVCKRKSIREYYFLHFIKMIVAITYLL